MCCEFLLENVTWGWCLAFTNSLQLDKIKKAVKASVLDTITMNNTTYLSQQLCLTLLWCSALFSDLLLR